LNRVWFRFVGHSAAKVGSSGEAAD
jgi:hypothetical protein